MKQENTKQKILDTALRLFSERGYDSVTVDDIAKAVGIKAPSLYNHYSGKRAIFDAIVDNVSKHYALDTDKIDIHVEDSVRDAEMFDRIDEEFLFEKVKKVFEYSLHDETIRNFRKMMTLEQFASSEFGMMYSERFVDRLIRYHSGIFASLIKSGEITGNADALAWLYVSPVLAFIGICDREPDREEECLNKLKAHVTLFYAMAHRK